MVKPNKKITFSQLAEIWIGVHMAGRSDDQVRRARRTLMRHLVRIGNEQVGLITKQSLDIELIEIANESSYDTANRARQMLVRVFDYAIECGVVKHNPASLMETPYLDRRGRSPMRKVDKDVLFSLLSQVDWGESYRVVRAAIKLSILLFQKTGHIQAMRWADVELSDESKIGVWRIPKSQTVTGQVHCVPIAPHAYDVLMDLRSYTGDGVFVFPSRVNPERFISNNTVRKAALGMGYDGVCSSTIRSVVKKSFLAEGGRKIFIDAIMGLTPDVELAEYILGWDAIAYGVMDWWACEIVCGETQRLLPRAVMD